MEVKWSPNHEDKFYTFGTNLALYKINDIPDDNSAWKEGGEYSGNLLNKIELIVLLCTRYLFLLESSCEGSDNSSFRSHWIKKD